MAKVPVFFDPEIPLADAMRAAEHIGCTLTKNQRGELLVVPKGKGEPLPLPHLKLIQESEHE